MKLILYDHRKCEPFQTKASIEPKLSNFNLALMNVSLTLEIINLVSFNFVFYSTQSIQVI